MQFIKQPDLNIIKIKTKINLKDKVLHAFSSVSIVHDENKFSDSTGSLFPWMKKYDALKSHKTS